MSNRANKLEIEFAVRAETDQFKRFCVRLAVDQNEIGTDVAVAMVLLISCERMIAEPGRKRSVHC
jgi:hypothetical protein